MPATYERCGLCLQYPENWTLAEEDPDDEFPSLTLQSPGGALWTLAVHPASRRRPDLMAEVLRTMKDEYEGLESAWTTEQIGRWDAVGYDMDFICLDFVVTAQCRCITVGGRNYVFLYEAESREFDQLKLVFQALMLSLLQGVG